MFLITLSHFGNHKNGLTSDGGWSSRRGVSQNRFDCTIESIENFKYLLNAKNKTLLHLR